MAREAMRSKAGWRRGWDSNPRYLAVRLISSQVHSTTLPPLLGVLLSDSRRVYYNSRRLSQPAFPAPRDTGAEPRAR